jgi:hypothetical protein
LFTFGDACGDFVDDAAQVIDVVKLVVFAGKADEGDLVEIYEVAEDDFADAETGDFFFAGASQVFFDGIEEGLDAGAGDVALADGGEDAVEEFFAAETLAATIALDDGEARGLLDAFVGGEAFGTGQTLAAAADDGPAVGGAAVDDLVMVFFAKGALHGVSAYSP